MTEEELKKEAIQYAVDYPTNYGKGYKHKDLRIAYLAGAEPREKEIKSLGERCLQLQKDKGRLTDKLTKAKEIIKKIEKIFYSSENALKRLSEISDILIEAEQLIKE